MIYFYIHLTVLKFRFSVFFQTIHFFRNGSKNQRKKTPWHEGSRKAAAKENGTHKNEGELNCNNGTCK